VTKRIAFAVNDTPDSAFARDHIFSGGRKWAPWWRDGNFCARYAAHNRPDPPFDRAIAKPARESRGGLRRRMFEARSVAGLDFIAQRRSFAKTNGRIARRRRFAFLAHGVNRDLRKARGA